MSLMRFIWGLILLNVVSAVVFTNTDFSNIKLGEPFLITWTDASGPIVLRVKTGSSTDLVTYSTLVSSSTTSYQWIPSASMPSGVYSLEIEDSKGPNYSPQFQLGTGSVSSDTSKSVTKTGSTSNPPSTTSTLMPSPAQPTTTTTPPPPSTSSIISSSTSPQPSSTSIASPDTSASPSESSSISSSLTSSSTISGSTSSPPSTSSQTSSVPTSSISTSSPSPNQASTPITSPLQTITSGTGNSGLSTAGKAGIGVGVTFGFLITSALFVFVFWYIKSKRTPKADPEAIPSKAELGPGRPMGAELAGVALNDEEKAELERRRRAAELEGHPPVSPAELDAGDRAELQARRKMARDLFEMG